MDCGDSCAPKRCPTDEICQHNEDCQSLVCEHERCSEPTCDDRVANGTESDVDCGGVKCPKCSDRQACKRASDCESDICREERCVQASCVDGQLSPGETGKDCGGPCGPCPVSEPCEKDPDCESYSCVGKRCVEASCSDGRKNQDETDIDCGGAHCLGCDTGGACMSNSGCMSSVCLQHECAAPTCDDFTRNGDENSVDCGGSCDGCPAGIPCESNDACASLVCSEGLCQAPRCDDGVKNGSESDRDCGTGCTPCAINRSCISNDDCMSKACAETCLTTLRVELLCSEHNSSTNEARPFFRIVNGGKLPFALSSLSLRYYYSRETTAAEQYNCYSVTGGNCSLLNPAAFGDVSPKTSTADRYLELHFAAKAATLAVNQSVEIQGAFFLTNHPAFIQTNDYSFSTSAVFLSSDHVTLYANGVLIWGVEP